VVNSGGTLQVNSGYTLNLAEGNGDDLTVNGNLTVIGSITYDTGANMAAGSGSTIKFAGTTGGQTTGTGFPSSVYNLIIDNPNGVTLSSKRDHYHPVDHDLRGLEFGKQHDFPTLEVLLFL
jgi:hypothetical protein